MSPCWTRRIIPFPLRLRFPLVLLFESLAGRRHVPLGKATTAREAVNVLGGFWFACEDDVFHCRMAYLRDRFTSSLGAS
jgi:hypothetical protein